MSTRVVQAVMVASLLGMVTPVSAGGFPGHDPEHLAPLAAPQSSILDNGQLRQARTESFLTLRWNHRGRSKATDISHAFATDDYSAASFGQRPHRESSSVTNPDQRSGTWFRNETAVSRVNESVLPTGSSTTFLDHARHGELDMRLQGADLAIGEPPPGNY